MLRAVLDTNQLVSSLLSTQGLQAQLIDAWRRRAYVLLFAPGQIEEVGEVLARPKITRKYPVSLGDRGAFLDLLRAEAILLPDAPAPAVCRNPDDDYVLGCAKAGAADYLVTGDADLLSLSQYKGVSIVGAREFLSVVP